MKQSDIEREVERLMKFTFIELIAQANELIKNNSELILKIKDDFSRREKKDM